MRGKGMREVIVEKSLMRRLVFFPNRAEGVVFDSLMRRLVLFPN